MTQWVKYFYNEVNIEINMNKISEIYNNFLFIYIVIFKLKIEIIL